MRKLLSIIAMQGVFTLAGVGQLYAQTQRNVIIFVADGLRPGSINDTDAPTMAAIRRNGVFFANSHAMFPTFTTPNASAIATGHYLGDTGDFSNTIFSGFAMFDTGNFGKSSGTVTPFVENDQVLADLNDHLGGNYLGEETLLSLARGNGYNTAAVGKLGPVAIQDVTQLTPSVKNFPTPQTVIIDDLTGVAGGVPLDVNISAALSAAGMSTTATPRNQPSGSNTSPGTLSANIGQQQYFADSVTKAILPRFKASGRPFVLVYWSRDPDGSQHNNGDSLNSLTPGINGPTSRAAIKNADTNLKQIMDYVNSDASLSANTDVFLTADHGFATISKHDVDNSSKNFSQSYSAQFVYKTAAGVQEVNTGYLPAGFLAIDLAHALNLPLFDPDSILTDSNNKASYEPVDPTIAQQTATVRQRPASGDGFIGGTGSVTNIPDGKVFVAANGGSDLVYVPDHDRQVVLQMADFLSKQDYVGGLFADDIYGDVPGTLRLSNIGLKGTTEVPTPALVVAFKTFALDPTDRLQSAIQIADSTLQHGQGMHGSIGRDNTFNNMAAIGPDFKKGFVDRSPVINADIPVTFAHILGLPMSRADLTGRVIREALAGGPSAVASESKIAVSSAANSGSKTVLLYQQVGTHLYFDEGCFLNGAVDQSGSTVNPCIPAVQSFLTASPNPIPVTGNSLGTATINWSASSAQMVELHVGSPNGALFSQGGSSGSATTGPWVTDGMTFYLQDVSGGKALTAANTLATLVVRLQRQ